MRRIPLIFLCCWLAVSARADPPEVQCSQAARGAPVCILETSRLRDTCHAIGVFAARHGIDPHFFTRLIWQESRFDPHALSPAGAEGIAQFMPATARRRGLRDPYNPAEALDHAAAYLAEMTRRFGNPGLAAIGYNGGEGRAAGLIAGTGGLARETVDYVRIITGLPHPMWLQDPAPRPDMTLAPGTPFDRACQDLGRGARPSAPRTPDPVLPRWGIQMAHGLTRQAAAAKFTRMTRDCAALIDGETPDYVFRESRASPRGGYVMARLGRADRDTAWRDCAAFKRAGCLCVVFAN